MKQYLDLLKDVIENGEDRDDRTGTGTRGVFFRHFRHDLNQGFPLLTTKRIHTKSVIAELLWIISGSTNIKPLQDQGVKIWNEWADEFGEIGPIYGAQWVNWKNSCGYGNNQIARLVDSIKTNPNSRRHVVSAWNVDYLPNERFSPQYNVNIGRMALAPCHVMAMFYVSNDRKLSCAYYMRSNDLFIGNPFNTASYALLTHMIAQQCDLCVGEIVGTYNDLHIYKNHLTDDIVYEQLRREPRPLPTLQILRKPESIFDYRLEDFAFENYNPHPSIKAPISV